MVFQLTGMFVSPTVECIDDTLKVFLLCFIFQGTVAKCDIEDAVDVIPETLILPEHFQDFRNCGEGILGPA
jgi:hypothetical protein